MLTTFAALIMPVIILLMAMVINTGHIVDSKIRLQIAVDRAAYAGAAKQAHIMNWMASQNHEIHKKYSDLKKELEDNSKQSVEEGRRRFNSVKQEINNIWSEMNRWSGQGMVKAAEVSDAVARANYARGYPMHPPQYRNMLLLRDDLRPEQIQTLKFDGMKGIFVDPTDHDSKDDRILSYLIKDERPTVRWMTRLQADLPTGFLTKTLNALIGGMKLNAASAAQPHGGSIEGCAFQDPCSQYQVSFIPVSQVTGGNYAH